MVKLLADEAIGDSLAAKILAGCAKLLSMSLRIESDMRSEVSSMWARLSPAG